MPTKATKPPKAPKPQKLFKNQRKHVRFPAPSEVYAALTFNYYSRGDFVPELHGLVVNESFKGCCLVVLNQRDWTVGAQVWVKIGEVGPLEARVRWVELVSSDTVKLGLEFLE